MKLRILLALSMCLSLWGEVKVEDFPPPGEGMELKLIHLPEVEDESLLRVGLLVGKTVEVDPVNRFFFAGVLESKTLEGFGYTYYQLGELGAMAGTRMMPPPDAEKVKKFVTISGSPTWVRYNSRMPIVVYVPEGVEVKYRIWTAGELKDCP